MKNSIKRAQSQARLSFAERENFRPKVRQLKKTILTLVALLAVTTGAWADEQYPIVYDFEAAANAGEDPSNNNGSAANGQAFYGWEKSDRTDSKRQDYKGYKYAEGSKLPEVCHVWRRSDRINGNVAGKGGLYCPSDKEMAVDGLTEGLTVTIIYDATNATNKEIVWAIGDGSSEGGPGEVRAKATINGVEAVPGQTTIKSGDMIIVNSVTKAENGSGYIVFAVKKDMVIKQIIVDVAPTATPVALTRGTGEKINEWTLTNGMPAGNVEVNVDYFPQATADGAVTAATGVAATTDEPLVTVDETMLTGVAKMMYYVSTSTTAPAYDAEGWTDVLPTAANYTEAGNLNVWYYPVGTDEGVGGATATYSDGDMNTTALTVTLAPEPTYNVEFAEGTNPEAPADPIWTATPNTGVKKGQTVTVTYTGTKKVLGVKAEKKTATATLADALVDGAVVKIDYTWDGVHTIFTFTNNGGTYSCTVTGNSASNFAASLTKNGNTLTFVATNDPWSDANLNIDFYAMDNGFYFNQKGSYYQTFTISVNGTDVKDQLSELK